MEKRQLLGVYDGENGICRVYAGERSDTPEKLHKLMEAAAIPYAKTIRRKYPEIWNEIARSEDK